MPNSIMKWPKTIVFQYEKLYFIITIVLSMQWVLYV